MFLLRYGTQDLTTAHEVLDDNEYELPSSFEAKDIIIDIGAHIGSFAKACLDRGAGKLICYEPDLDNFKMLLQNVQPPPPVAAHLYNKAVWDKTRDLHLAQLSDRRATAMSHTLGNLGPLVPAVSIAHVLSGHKRIRLLKLDCEGAERPILDAMTPEMAVNVQEIVGEVHFTAPGVTVDWLQETMNRLGFSVRTCNNAIVPDMLALFLANRKEVPPCV